MNEITIEISQGTKDLDILKDLDLNEIENMSLIFFKSLSINFLSKFNNLKSLGLAGSSLKNYTPLTNCLTLESLSISSANIRNLDIINTLKIKYLSLELIKSKDIKDLSFLRNATNLESINLFDVNIQELTDFFQLKNLKHVSIGDCKFLKNITMLKTATSLRSLTIFYQRNSNKSKFNIKKEVADLLKHLPKLEKLSVGNMVYDEINHDEIINELKGNTS